MNREEAIKVIKAYKDKLTNSASNQLDGDIEALDMAITALEQEPLEVEATKLQKAYNKGFEDCRQAVLEQTYLWSKDEFLRVANPFDYLRKKIMDLPLVNPQEPKTGHWITTRTLMHDGEYYCNKCKQDAPNNKKYKYCPNCRARMIESEEQE